MAEKPRLKKLDEILGSITAEPSSASRRGAAASRSPNSGQERRRPPEPAIQPGSDDEEEGFELSEPTLPSAQALAEKIFANDNRRKLNFEKYELPKRAQPVQATASIEIPVAPASVSAGIPAAPASASVEIPVAPPPVREQAPAPVAAPPSPTVPPPVSYEQNFTSTPTVMEYTFQSFEDEEEHPVREFQMARENNPEPEARRSLRERARRHTQPQETAVPEAGRQQAEQDVRSPRNAPEPPQAFEPPPAPPKRESEDPAAIEQRNRQEFLDRIASQFEQQFGEKFEQGIMAPRDAAKKAPSPPPRQPSIFEKPAARDAAPFPRETPRPGARPGPRIPESPEEDFLATVQRQERDRQRAQSFSPRTSSGDESSAQDFISKFQQDVISEEEQRNEDFKETLAEKFMRERERYLKELGITMQESELEPEQPDSPGSQFTPPPRRKLDFQIQPEMHMQEGEQPRVRAAQNGPVTYNRGAVTKPQISAEDENPALKANSNGAKKTSEQLLMEHGRRSRAMAPQPAGKQKPPPQLKFTFKTPEEQAQTQVPEKTKSNLLPKEKWPRRIVIISMISGLLAIGLLVWPLVRYMQISQNLVKTGEPSSAPVSAFTEDTLTVYESRSFDQTAKVSNVVFKKADATLKNVDVDDYVVIEGIDSKGKIRLEDMNIHAAVSVKASGIDTLELHNVKAERVIINNPTTDVTVNATGTTDISVIEVRTPAVVRQTELTGDAPGVRDMLITAAQEGGNINAKLDGLSLTTLNTDAVDSVLTFENDTRAEIMSCEGSLSLTGTGKVVNLSIGSKTGLGAGDGEERGDVSLVIKDVTVTNLNVKSPASLNIATAVDSIATVGSVSINGTGSVGTLTLNPGISASRLLADIADINIQSIYSNTPSRTNITGTSHVTAFVAEASAYVLGNKVNHLIANANDVIYEVEPDKTTVANGINPPQSKAENPNLDYGIPRDSLGIPGGDTTSGDFGTTCGHSRESGGFLVGDGSEGAPYEVSTPMQLAHAGEHLSSNFIQINDIDIAGEAQLSTGFTMIGSGSTPFAGVYDGAGFSISNLSITSSDENAGLFAVNNGTIQNVLLVSGKVTSKANKQAFVGGLVGLNLEGASIRSCSNGAAVSGNEYTYTGGIAGYNFNAKIHDCFNYAKISGVNTVGGLVGLNRQSAALTGSYNAGDVEGEEDIGSVAGKNENATIANCYYLTDTAYDGIGNGSGTAIEKDSDELQDPQMAADLSAGNENSLWVSGVVSAGGYRYPMHKKPASAP